MPIRAPKFSPMQRQRDRVERAENEADERLSAHEAGDGPVDIAGDGADGVPVAHRHPGIDGAHHAVPIDEHVERDDRASRQEGRRCRAAPARRTRGLAETCPIQAMPWRDQVADGGLHVRQSAFEPPSRSIRGPPCSTANC